MTIYYANGSETSDISIDDIDRAISDTLDCLGERKKVLLLPPDFTRLHSQAGLISQRIYEKLGNAVTDVMPALGTHVPLTEFQRNKMFGNIPEELFRVHDWRNDVVDIGLVPAEMVSRASDGHLNLPWPAQVNKLVIHGQHDLIVSIGQVVPHEVMGMSNYNKNILIGVGGKDAIDYSHFVGAAYGMERMMGKADNPLRQILNYAADHFLNTLPVIYVLTVVGRREDPGLETCGGTLAIRGLYIGDDISCFDMAAELSTKVNFTLVSKPLSKVIAFMDENEYHSTWLANKAIYRTRMAIADGGELLVLAPGVKQFGEDVEIDAIIRKFGYRTTPEIMKFLESSLELRKNLSVAAHLIHGSTEGRFNVTYCLPKEGLSREEIEGVGYDYACLEEILLRYNPKNLKEGWNVNVDGESVYFISKPALGLWALQEKLLKN